MALGKFGIDVVYVLEMKEMIVVDNENGDVDAGLNGLLG